MSRSKDKKLNLFFQRFEWKFIISYRQMKFFYDELLNRGMVPDPYAKDNINFAYQVNSIYFDSPGLRCYHNKISGLNSRFKLRLRSYSDWNVYKKIFIEIKKKRGDIVIKERAVLEGLALNAILSGEKIRKDFFLQKDNNFFQNLSFLERRFNLLPIAGVSYLRKPLIGSHNERIRITFDYCLKTFEPKNRKSLFTVNDFVVMEVKYDNKMPVWVKDFIASKNIDKQAYSKYTNCLEQIPFYKIKLNSYA